MPGNIFDLAFQGIVQKRGYEARTDFQTGDMAHTQRRGTGKGHRKLSIASK